MVSRRPHARALLALLALWLLGQAVHDPLVHRGEWSHAGRGDHSFCSLFQGLHALGAEAPAGPAPLLLSPSRIKPATPCPAPAAQPPRLESRGPPLA